MTPTALAVRLTLAAALAAVALPCLAQGMPDAIGPGGFQPPVKNNRPPPAAALPPPAAIPGARSRPDTVAPAEKLPTDMQPTDALFDAINRGDIATARDALNRGADLEGHNVLGMTPLELSVDLARNDITFLLLSLRGADAGARTKPGALATLPADSPKATRKGHKNGTAVAADSGVAAATPAHARKGRVAPVADAEATAPQPTNYARGSDPGTPVPQAGFLGFGGAAQP